jgi:hypothetical protein
LRFAELNLADAFLRLDDDVFRVGHELHGAAEEASGRRVVMVPAQNGKLDLLVNAAFTATPTSRTVSQLNLTMKRAARGPVSKSTTRPFTFRSRPPSVPWP